LVVLVCAVVFVDAMLFGALVPLVPGYADEFGLSKTTAGLLVGAFGAGALLGGVPGGLAAARWGPRRAVLGGLLLLAVASFAFALSGSPWALGAARFVQGFSSTTTWAGALPWLTVAAPRARRGEVIGTAFGFAVLGAILGPPFGSLADVVGIERAFLATGVVALVLAAWAAATADAPPERQRPGAVARAFADRAFVGGLWLNMLPAMLFGLLGLLAPLRLDDGGLGTVAIGSVFFAAGLAETVLNPLIGRFSDRRGRLLPTRLALGASAAVAVALALAERPAVVVPLVAAAAISFGAFYTPGMALVSDRTEAAGLAQGLGFGIMNSAWAAGNLTGPVAGGALANALGDAVPYLAAGALCLGTLLATGAVRPRRAAAAAAESARAPSPDRAAGAGSPRR
jgi:predicted MFS family arabinose efflux permease